MVQRNSNDWIRKAEILSLAINIIGWPLGFFTMAVINWYIVLPATSSPIVIEFGIILLIIVGIIFDSRFGPVGLYLIQPFKNFLSHSETEDDRQNAVASFFGTFCLFAVYYGILSIIFSL